MAFIVLIPFAVSADHPLLLVHGFFTRSFGTGMCWDDANETKLASWAGIQSNLVQTGEYSNGGIINMDRLECPRASTKPPVYRFTYYKTCYEEKNAIEEYTKRLSEAIDFAKNCSQTRKVDLVAHSLGGIIARNYLEEGGDKSVNKVVFVATPHEGISFFPMIIGMPACILGKLSPFCPAEINEINSNSEIMKRLKSHKKLSVKAYTIKSSSDILIPREGPDSIESELSFSVDCNHDDIFRPRYCPKGYEAVVESLKS